MVLRRSSFVHSLSLDTEASTVQIASSSPDANVSQQGQAQPQPIEYLNALGCEQHVDESHYG